MGHPLRSADSAPLMIGGAVVGLTGILVVTWFSFQLGMVVALIGLAVEISGAWVHDHNHRRRAEPAHAMWGLNDRNRPSWLPRGRRD